MKVAVIDYGMGNLRSVSKAVEHVAPDAEVRVTDDHAFISQADRIVFPGQGAARDCMAAIGEHDLNQAVLEAARSKPFFGICMGLQVLMRHSEENDGTSLLGLIPGEVIRFPVNMREGDSKLKVPHMGWNQVHQAMEHELWSGINDGERFYFVHSYFVKPEDRSICCGETTYGIPFTCAVAKDNLFAVQFHPEKSAQAGLQLLRNFISWDI
jgi:glutamine amidotransferase